MKKFVILALFACVATALAAPSVEIDDAPSELAIFEDNEKETASLTGDKKIFEDFCLSTRDSVKNLLGDKVNQGVGQVFKKVVEAFEEVNKAITAGEREVLENNLALVNENYRNIPSAIIDVLSSMKKEGKQKVFQIFNGLREQLNLESFQDIADKACYYIAQELKPKLDRKLRDEKSKLKSGKMASEFREVIDNAKIENLGCVTTSRVTKVASACRMVNLVAPMALDFFKKN